MEKHVELFKGVDSWAEHEAWVKFSYTLMQKINSLYVTDFEKIYVLNSVYEQLEECGNVNQLIEIVNEVRTAKQFNSFIDVWHTTR